jgi:hypothetical protein
MKLVASAMSLVFVDCEAVGPCPGVGRLKEFGAVIFETKATFHGIVEEGKEPEAFRSFAEWLKANAKGRPVFVSDNPAYDWQWINDGFHRFLGHNPFGHSARRISDFYAGLCGDFYKTQNWKRLRVKPHDHNPVHDALGNVEAFERLLRGER